MRSLRICLSALLLQAGLAVMGSATAALSPQRPEPLAGTCRAIAAEIDALPDGGAGMEAFGLLARRLRSLPDGPGELAGLSVWDAEGRLLSWAGDVHTTPPRDIPSAPLSERVRDPSGREVHLLWTPLARGGSLLAESLSGSAAPAGEFWSRWSMPGAPLHLAGILLAAACTILLARRPAGHRLPGVLLLSLAVWLLRAWCSLVVRSGAPLDVGMLSSPSLYASRFILDLYRSPLDAFLTGGTLMAQAVLLLRLVPQAGNAAWRRLLTVPGAAGLIAGLIMAGRAGTDSRLDLAGLTGRPPEAAALAVQCGLLLGLWAPVILLAAGLQPRPRPHLLLRTALLVPPLAALLFLSLSLAAEQERRDLITGTLRFELADHASRRRRALEDTLQGLQEDGELPRLLSAALAGGTADDLAYRLWRGSELGLEGYHSSLEIHAGEGWLAGSFAFHMPPPLPRFTSPSGDGDGVEVEHLVFATLSQQQAVLSARLPVRDQEGTLLAVVTVSVAHDEGNIPSLTADTDSLPWVTAGPETRRLLRGPALVTLYDRQGRLLWSAQPDPPPLAPTIRHADDLAQGFWRASEGRDGGHIFCFAADDIIYTLGYTADAWTRPAARLLRFVMGQLAVLLALTLILLPLTRPLRRLRRDGLSLLAWFLSSWGRKLAAAVLLASLVPLLGLAALLRAPLERQRQESLNTLGLQSLEVARRVVMDAMVAVSGEESPQIPSDETLYWLSRVIRQDIDLFMDQRLVATSRRGLFTAGIVSPLPDAEAYARIVLRGQTIHLPAVGEPATVPAAVSAALDRPGAGAATLRLPFGRQEEAVAMAGAAVSERADLATAALALLLILAAALVGRATAGRLHRLTRATSRLARGEEDVLVPLDGRDELTRLTASFNTMATALASQRRDLQRRTETLENLVSHAPIGIVHLDGEDLVLMLNPAAQRLLATHRTIHPGAGITAALGGSPYGSGLEALLRAAGEAATGTGTRDLEPDAGGDARLRAVVLGLPGGRGERLLLLEDITESIRSGRLSAWADMARRIAHEIKNPLTPIRLAAEHLQRVHTRGDTDLDTALEKTTATILGQVEALREIASNFSLYARLPEMQPRRVPARKLLEETLAAYDETLPPEVDLQVDLAADLPTLWIDPDLIRRALVNLVENALQAMPEGGSLTVGARADQQRLTITVSDTGSGMDAATLARVFEPYFSTRDAGTGLGLAIARRTVEEHGGTLEARSQPGHGTTFSLTLPVPDRNAPTG